MGHLHPAAVQYPPDPAGWADAELNVEALRALGRNEVVIDLLRHLPYPRAGPPGSDQANDDAVILYETMALNYLRDGWRPEKEEEDDPEWFKQEPCMLGLAPFSGPMPPHLISLTWEEATEVGTVWMVDTERGCIYPFGKEYGLYSDAPSDVEEKSWLTAKAMSFQRYFGKIYRDICSLKLVPAPAAGNFGHAICAPIDSGRQTQALKKLYLECGWPDAFRKEEFLRVAEVAPTAILDDTHD